MRFFVATVIVLIIGCSKIDNDSRKIDPRLEAVLAEIEKAYDIYIGYEISIGTTTPGNVGECIVLQETSSFLGQIVGSQAHRRIILSETYLDATYYDPAYISNLLLHEIGHCSFRLAHDNRVIEAGPMFGCPCSVMVTPLHTRCFEQNKDYYFQEMADKAGIVYYK